MREILFRGKTKVTNRWVYGYFSRNFGDASPQIRDVNDCCYNAVNSETVGQYTGLTDKNGKKIFEGDIFKFDDEVLDSCYTSCGTEYSSWKVENYGVIGFDNDRGCFDFCKYKFNENSVEADLNENKDLEFADFIADLEVIGNIVENPNLLEDE